MPSSDGPRRGSASTFLILVGVIGVGFILTVRNLRGITVASSSGWSSFMPTLPAALYDEVKNISAPPTLLTNTSGSYHEDKAITLNEATENMSLQPLQVFQNATNESKIIDFKPTADQQPTVIVMAHAFKGRLGNYLMQYSAALGLVASIPDARLCQTQMTMKRRRAILKTFAGPFAPLCSPKLSPQKDWSEANATYQDGFVEEARNCSTKTCVFRMVGFWSSHLYHEPIREELRGIWNLTDHGQIQEYIPSMENVTYIGIHIRRGDMMAVQAYRLPEMDYYQRAMQHYRTKYGAGQARFMVASDDKTWCRQAFHNTSDATVLPDSLNPPTELVLLANCRHVIQSVGTFGWWAAYLSRSNESIYPKSAYENDYWTETRLRHHLPASWVGL